MPRRPIARFLAVVLVLAVFALGTHAVSHWDSYDYDGQHCRVCHVGSAAVPQFVARAELQAPAPIARFIAVESAAPDAEAVRTLSIPRAPPA